MLHTLVTVLVLATPGRNSPDRPAQASGMTLLFESDLARGIADWTLTDPEAWRVETTPEGPILHQFAPSKYQPPVRSPLNIALLPGVQVQDFVLDLELRSTARDYDHRDVCLFLGHNDPSHFYYVHLAKAADPHAHSIFRVDGAPRVSIAAERTNGVVWTDSWHHARVVHRTADGTIEVYFDDLEHPIMRANDRAFGQGRIGVGSFDDTAQFRAIRVWAPPQRDSN